MTNRHISQAWVNMKKVAFITGGAGGIASALAQRLIKRGYRLVLLDRDLAGLKKAAAALTGEVRLEQVDLTSYNDLDRAANMIRDEPSLQLLVNNDGLITPGDVVDLQATQLDHHIMVNLIAPMHMTQAAAKRMKAQKSGCILSIVSAAGLVALPGSAAYSASNLGLRGFLIALNQKLSAHCVKVRGVFPGAVDTPLLRYEATHGGSPLNFLNKDVLTKDQVADACLKAMDGSALEVILPRSNAFWSRLAVVGPGLMSYLLPRLTKQGEQGLAKFLSARGLTKQVIG